MRNAPLRLAAGPVVKLRILETTDLHVNIFPYDYYRDAADDTVGLARTATLVKAARAEAKNSLLFDNGDLIQGSPLGDFVAYRKGMKPGDVHPMVAAMNELNYDCGTLGNHEFNYGLDFLQNVTRRGEIPARLRQRDQGQWRDLAEAVARARTRVRPTNPAPSRR